MSRYILVPIAQEDLTNIRDYYLDEAGYRVARQMLVQTKPLEIIAIVRASRDLPRIIDTRRL